MRVSQPASPKIGTQVFGEELREVWQRWSVERRPDDAAILMMSLRPIAWDIARGLLDNDVDDLVQETLVQVLEGRSAPSEGVWNYIKTVVIKAHAKVLRREYDGPKKKGGRRVHHLSYEDPAIGGETGEVHALWSDDDGFRSLSTRGIADPRLRQVTELLQMGFSKAEVAARLKISERSLERIITNHARRKAAVIPTLNAAAQYAVRFRVIVRPTAAQWGLLHTMQLCGMAA